MPAVASRSQGRGRRTINEINMVPFIDVMLVLLIIFMVTAPLITPSLIDLPTVGQAARQPERYVQVIIDKDGMLRVRGSEASADSAAGQGVPVTIDKLAAEVKARVGPPAAGPSVPVVISADRSVKYEAVVKAMDTLQRAGVARVGLSVQAQP